VKNSYASLQIRTLIGGLTLLACFAAALWPVSALAQWAFFDTPTTSTAQRNALHSVQSQVGWLQNSTRTAQQGEQGYGNVWRSFQDLRLGFFALTQTLTPRQSMYGANDLAELNAGLDLIQEAFTNYEEDIAAGRPAGPALQNLCRVLHQGSVLWSRELNKTSSRLRIGW
jgi:hypothetical protein